MRVLLADGDAPGLLVSVRDAGEACLAQASGADLVDAKDPANGALGALPPGIVAQIVRTVRSMGRRVLTSAVAGEPETAVELARAVDAMAATGVDFVKVALPSTGPAAVASSVPVIAALFAEDGPQARDVAAIAAAGFSGAMIDTRRKDGRRLTDLLAEAELTAFAAACRGHGLVCGLAGSLRIEDISQLAAYAPDYLGFRGGLCAGSDRRGGLDGDRIADAARRLAELRRRQPSHDRPLAITSGD